MENKYKKYTIYIDESGIISKIGHSVYVLVYIECLNEFNIGEHILKIEKNLNISHIHWVNMSRKIRIKLAKRLKDLDFECKYILFNNPILQEKALENVLIELLKSNYTIFKIIIDGESSKKYENKLKTVLKNKGIKVYKIKFTNDKNDPLLRLADFMAGLIRSYSDKKNKDNTYIYDLLKRKIKIPD
jgi:hypothetical protein